jgi:putative ABC transport system substrate-binding protein
MPVVGFLHSGGEHVPRDLERFHSGLREAGFVEGENVAIEFRFAHDQYQQLPVLAAELVRKRVAVIFTTGGAVAALAAKGATPRIPIVFVHGSDPVATGLVASLNRPGGNVTGVTFVTGELQGKSLELLREAVPGAGAMAALVNSCSATGENRRKDVEAAARALGIAIRVVNAAAADEFETAFSALAQQKVAGLLLVADPLFRVHHKAIVALATRHAIAMMAFGRDFVEAVALMSCGANLSNSYRQAGVYVGRILKGAKPADLPVLQPTTFELVINLRAAKALGLTVPPKLLALSDEVIE